MHVIRWCCQGIISIPAQGGDNARGGSQLVSDDVASSGMNKGTLISTTQQINDDAETVTGLIGDGGKRSN
jgi:hypothetical protein